jgi:hypothetical protein
MRFPAWLLASALALFATGARAEVSPTERALARELFEQGRELMLRQKYAAACAKLAESQRLDPAAGTLLNLAVCHEAEGKTATAWSEFNDALTLARRDGRADRVALATQRIEKLEPVLSRLTIRVAEAARVEGLVVRLDGSSVGAAVFGTGMPVDPGTHVIEASAPGRESWRTAIEVGDSADRKLVEIPALARRAAAPGTAAPPLGTAPSSDAPADRGDGGSQRAIGYVVGGVGLVGIGVGSYFGLRAFALWDDRNRHCTPAGCDPEGVEAGQDAERAAMFSNLGIGLGLAAAGIGAYLVLSAGSGEPRAAASASATGDGRGALLSYRASF